MVCFDNAQKHNLYITCLINKKKSEAYKDSFKSKQNMINSLPAFTNYTDIRNVLSDTEASVPCQVFELIRLDILHSFAPCFNAPGNVIRV